MSDETKGTTVFLDAEMIVKADTIATYLGVLVGGKLSRTAVVRRALADLFLAICPNELTNDHSDCQPADVAA